MVTFLGSIFSEVIKITKNLFSPSFFKQFSSNFHNKSFIKKSSNKGFFFLINFFIQKDTTFFFLFFYLIFFYYFLNCDIPIFLNYKRNVF